MNHCQSNNHTSSLHPFQDPCLIDNGGCGINSICSFDEATDSIKCLCKTGYTNTASAAKVNCTGNYDG